MRAILIDPEKRSFTEVQIDRGIEGIQRLLQCRSFTSGAKLSGSMRYGFESIYVSDDLLEDRDDPQFWFQVDANRNPPSSYPIAGFGLAHGVDPDGETCDLKISIDDLKKRVTFSRRKFRGFSVEHGDGSKGFHLKITPVGSSTVPMKVFKKKRKRIVTPDKQELLTRLTGELNKVPPSVVTRTIPLFRILLGDYRRNK